jgi:hypothetical protein
VWGEKLYIPSFPTIEMHLLFNRLISIFVPLLIVLGLEIILLRPKWFWGIGAILLTLLILGIWQLLMKKVDKENWQFFLAPFLFFLSSFLFFIFLTPRNTWLKHLLILFIASLLAIILESIFNFLHRPEKYPLFAIENIYSYLDLITFFFFSTIFYYLAIFFNFPLWILVLFILILTHALIYQVFWANKVATKKSFIFISVISLILGELFWIINFWPTGFYFNALLLSLFYYTMVGISRYHLLDPLDKKVVRKYLMVGGVCLVIVLLTGKWN